MSIAVGIVGVGLVAGGFKMWQDMQRWRGDMGREKAPWERAQNERL